MKTKDRRIARARQAICSEIGNRTGLHGKLPCPVCEKTGAVLRYSVSPDGAIWAHCSTPDCVSWME